MDVCRGAVSSLRSDSFRQSWRRAPPLRWFGPYSSMTTWRRARRRSPPRESADPGPRAAPPPSGTPRPAGVPARGPPRPSGTSRAGVPTSSTVSAPRNQPTDSPSSERAGTTALTTRWIGTKASSSAHHHRRHRAGNQGPDTVRTAASIAIHRGSSRNCDSNVLSRSDRSKCHCGAAMPLAVIDRASTALSPAAAYAPSSFHCLLMIRPIRIANGSARIAMPYTRYTTLDWVGVSTPTMPDIDFSSATQSLRVISELVMTAARTTVATHQAQDVVGPPGERLQQAARNGDFAPVDSHVPRISGSAPRLRDGSGQPIGTTAAEGRQHGH